MEYSDSARSKPPTYAHPYWVISTLQPINSEEVVVFYHLVNVKAGDDFIKGNVQIVQKVDNL